MLLLLLLQLESNYSRWQLLTTPIDLPAFNSIPLLTSMFFEYSLRLSADFRTPIVVNQGTEIKIGGWEVIRYKYKFYPACNCEQVREIQF